MHCHLSCVQYLARLRMDLDIANRRLDAADEEKRKLTQERDEVSMTYTGLRTFVLFHCCITLSSAQNYTHVSLVIAEGCNGIVDCQSTVIISMDSAGCSNSAGPEAVHESRFKNSFYFFRIS